MAVAFTRPYKEILLDMVALLAQIKDSYTSLEIEAADWTAMSQEEQSEVLEALADDLFYGMGQEAILFVGSGSVRYDREFHLIEISDENNVLGNVGLLDS